MAIVRSTFLAFNIRNSSADSLFVPVVIRQSLIDQHAPEECAVSSLRSPPVDSSLKTSARNSRNTGPTAENNKLRAQPMKRHREYITGILTFSGHKGDLLMPGFVLCR